MSGTPLASLRHSVYPLIMSVLVVLNQLLEYVELNGGTRDATLVTCSRSRNFLTPVDIFLLG